MKQLPLAVRIAAGLAATAVEQARSLPKQLAGLPVTVVSEALQLSMRVQQQVTELAIKGDEVLATLRPAEENPEWATFDEDEPAASSDPVASSDLAAEPDDGAAPDPWAQEERALAEETADGDAPDVLPGYNELTVAQLRARMRRLSLAELEELLAFERGHAARPPFVGMLTRRIATVSAQSS
ncbi:lipid droplet-associated protein [Solihabitans fulvus]|uniref:Lipid droplet-associated protein n=1 Tax=Solihabitans fulvus TaxID=1892852 RepID=A0A5B2XIY8_9PSEU|nr:lipid droplet-associated protein [Solihabitans fulvus]KAA2263216.1 lipid droplet-associated protein [Solihabitans fulvus]